MRRYVDVITVLREVENWSLEDQVQLAQQLWTRLEDQGFDPALTDDPTAELDRRLAAHQANPEAGSSWEEVKARLWSES
jgi:putative addiction module component (TIGR02574 family)